MPIVPTCHQASFAVCQPTPSLSVPMTLTQPFSFELSHFVFLPFPCSLCVAVPFHGIWLNPQAWLASQPLAFCTCAQPLKSFQA